MGGSYANLVINTDGSTTQKGSLQVGASAAFTVDEEHGNVAVGTNEFTIKQGGHTVQSGNCTIQGELLKVQNDAEVDGNLTVAKNFTTHDLTVSGDMTIQGNVTSVDTTVTRVEDTLLILGYTDGSTAGSGKPDTTIQDRGFQLQYQESSTDKKAFFGMRTHDITSAAKKKEFYLYEHCNVESDSNYVNFEDQLNVLGALNMGKLILGKKGENNVSGMAGSIELENAAYQKVGGLSNNLPHVFTVSNTGDVLAKQLTCFSDRRLKTNITDIESSDSAKLHDLLSVQYEWLSGDGGINFGLIAQDAQDVYPNIVTTTNGTLSIDYIQLIPLLIKEVQDLKKQVAELKLKHEPFA